MTTRPDQFPHMHALMERYALRQPKNDGDPEEKVRYMVKSAGELKARVKHCQCRGDQRLSAVVAELVRNCPWTATVDASTMISWMRSELDEFKAALEQFRDEGTEDAKVAREALISELGDVLFDALMLNAVAARELALDPDAAWKAAATKVENRTPYMWLWGDGSVARTAQEASGMWAAAKLRERAPADNSVDIQESRPAPCHLGNGAAPETTATAVTATVPLPPEAVTT
eukprot:CAMPEP_0172737000 /NCGR_PEP_ID=MMETSP1074-20121228/116542_1 /TAXON_ID=2916 /ORGANISM="Ceratium fusus, Strain PA161109" /LENGTH=229 /DNA_ID=CAMNT_0013566313 /DNA_START=218 /DNA_END=904 /DNA_ORIENTATION=+